MTTSTASDKRTNARQELEDIAALLPEQGAWSEEAYIWLTNHTNRLVEFNDGRIEILPMPTEKHQAILRYLFLAFYMFVEQLGGTVFFAALRLRLKSGKFREPDLLLLLSADDPRRGDAYWTGADLVLEVVSPYAPNRDLVKKRKEYAQAGIPEYWSVHPQAEQIIVLHLDGTKYIEHGRFGRGATATSALLADFGVNVDTALDAN
jgi:Uma2 family endonuclease